MAAERYIATTASGLEPVLEEELRALGLDGLRCVPGGVLFQGARADMVRACLSLRTAHRVRWQLGRFRARDADDLFFGARKVRWEGLVPRGGTFAVVGATRDNPELRSPRFVALRTKDAIVDRIQEMRGERATVDPSDPDVQVHVRVVRDDVTITLDAVGDSLHARGYRTDAGTAPLRETLAAGVVLRTKWSGERPLVDPFCGSGTLLIEAALIARDIAPGLLRDRPWAFQRWPGHKPKRLARIREELEARVVRDRPLEIAGSDRDEAVLRVAGENVARAGLADAIRLRAGDARRVQPVPGRGVIVGNPPYGTRLSDERRAEELLRGFGERLREAFGGWEAWLLLGTPEHGDALGLTQFGAWPLKNGALEVTVGGFWVG